MDRFDRIYELHSILRSARVAVPHSTLEERLECSRATVNRIIRNMRLYLGAPIVHDRERGGYFYDENPGHPYELPGLWFSADELYALLAAQQLLAGLEPGLLESHLAPLRERIQRILEAEHLGYAELGRRVRILDVAGRRHDAKWFACAASALATRRRLRIDYHGRTADQLTARSISPQRLVHYRGNWYLDAWCHLRRGLRSFSLDRIRSAQVEEEAAREVPDTELDAHFADAYGIFAGRAREIAVLRFTPRCARWVAEERWHPRQESRLLDDGGYELRIPYGDPRELVMDILKYGPEVEVIGPPGLRKAVTSTIREAAVKYDD